MRTREKIAVAAVFTIVSAMLVGLKLVRFDQQLGDSALFLQLLDNIAAHGVPMSSVAAAIIAIFKARYQLMTPEQFASSPLPSPVPPELNELQVHLYAILYPLALLVRLVPAEVVMMTAYVLSFTVALAIVYVALRRAGLGVPAAAAFCFVVAAHPAWSTGLWWQFYPDRLFIVAGLLLALTISAPRTPWPAALAAAVFAASIDERSALVAGVVVVLYALLYGGERRSVAAKLALGAALLAYAFVVMRYFLPENFFNGDFLPTTIAAVERRVLRPVLLHDDLIFIVVNGGLLALAAAEWRAAAIAAVVMLPNVIGTMGGVEKVGFYSHYHDQYLPILIWAGMRGWLALYRRWEAPARRVRLAGLAACLVVPFTLVDPVAGRFGLPNAGALFPVWFPQQVATYESPAGRAAFRWVDELRRAIPDHTVVTTVESAMPALYRNRRVLYLPEGVDRADYAVLDVAGTGAATTYSGVVAFKRGKEREINELLVKRMAADGYDFAHPVLRTWNGLVVVRRRT